MCKRRDSIGAVSAAADRLTETCEATLRGEPIDPVQPVRGGVGRSIRNAFRDLTVSPPDMLRQLGKLK